MAPRNPAVDDDDEDVQVEDEIEGQDEDTQEDDAGEGDDGAEAEGEGQEGPDASEGDGRRRVLNTRREGRESPIKRLSRQAQESQARADRLEREVSELRAQRQREQQPQESPEQEAARLALMDPDARSEYRLNKAVSMMQRENAATQFRLQDQTDKASFAAACAANPLYKRYAGKVETKLAEIRAKGQNVDRDALVKYLIGEDIATRGPKALKTQREAGERNVQRQKVRPGSGRSDQGRGERQAKNKYAHLEDVTF